MTINRLTLIALALSGLTLLLAGCPGGTGTGKGASSASSGAGSSAARPLSLCLLASDLGYSDGNAVRELNAVLADHAAKAGWSYTTAGVVAEAPAVQAGSFDVGLPWEDELNKGKPAMMRLDEAKALFDSVAQCDLLVLPSPYLLEHALELAAAGTLKAGALLVTDDQGPQPDLSAAPIPVYRFSYEVKDLGFLCGVAAATSANNAQFLVLTASDDPGAEDFMAGVVAGAHYTSAGANCVTTLVPVDEQGMVTPQDFSRAVNASTEAAGEYFKPNHYVLSLGRTTPSIMHALTKEPFDGFVVTGYSDYRTVRPARVSGTGLKRPGVMLKRVLDEYAAGKTLEQIFSAGVLRMGLADGAVGMGGYELYEQYNKDGDDLQAAVEETRKLILSDEILVEY